jgi:hypothetical protein
MPSQRKYFMKSYSKLAYAMAAYKDLKVNYDVLVAMQDYGLDELAMTQLFAFVQELHEAGILTGEDLPDFPADGVEDFSTCWKLLSGGKALEMPWPMVFIWQPGRLARVRKPAIVSRKKLSACRSNGKRRITLISLCMPLGRR